MSVETHRVLMGTCGWNHQAWLNNFYSEDLPEDWQLGFYSNEFPVVYVPARDWLDAINSDVEELSEWVDDVSEGFRFILEIPEEILVDESRFLSALENIKSLGESCLGVVFLLTPSICDDKQLFKQRLALAQDVVPVCIDKQGHSLSEDVMGILSDTNVSEVWDGKSDEKENYKRGSLTISHISGDELDMAGLRKVIEHCLSVSSEDCVSVFCLDGNPPSLELLRNADIILNLL